MCASFLFLSFLRRLLFSSSSTLAMSSVYSVLVYTVADIALVASSSRQKVRTMEEGLSLFHLSRRRTRFYRVPSLTYTSRHFCLPFVIPHLLTDLYKYIPARLYTKETEARRNTENQIDTENESHRVHTSPLIARAEITRARLPHASLSRSPRGSILPSPCVPIKFLFRGAARTRERNARAFVFLSVVYMIYRNAGICARKNCTREFLRPEDDLGDG